MWEEQFSRNEVKMILESSDVQNDTRRPRVD